MTATSLNQRKTCKNMDQKKFAVLWMLMTTALFSCAAGEKPEATDFEFPSSGVRVRQQAILLGIDDMSWPLKRDLCLYLSKPKVRQEPVLVPSRDNPNAPDYMAAHLYGTVLFEQGKFRMWYYAVHAGRDYSDLKQGPVCYAESNDGILWVKPNLGQVDFKGNRNNNVLRLPDEKVQAPAIIMDALDPNPQRRYKMVYNAHNGKTWVFRTGISRDGVQWNFRPEYAVDRFVELSSFYRHQALFVVNGQAAGYGEGGGGRGRQGYAWVSQDFDHWLKEEAEAFLLPEPAKATDRGNTKPYDQVHLGVGGASFGNVVVGLYGRWHNFPGDTSRPIPNSWFGFGQISCDLGLVISNDGLHFREPVKDHIYLSRSDSPVTPLEGKPYPTILCQSGNGILNVGTETRIYHGRWRNAEYGLDYWGEVALATLPRDRWGGLGLNPDTTEGSVWSAAVRLPSRTCEVWLNADAAKSIRVEIADEQFNLLPDYSGPNSGVPEKDAGLDCQVSWSKGALGALRGKTVRLRLHFKKQDAATPRLYALYFRIK
jgi:hypothetical protein